MNKKLTVAVAAAALSVSMAVPAMAQWNNLGNNNWQWLENGVAVKDQWVTTENGQYYINLDGLCSYNWINWNGNWYFGQQGSNLGNVVKNGWASVDGSYYYFGADGVMATGTQTINGVTYTFDANGHCTTTPTGVSYATYSTGAAATTASTVSGGGGSSSGGGSSTSMPAPSEAARETQTTLRDSIDNTTINGASVNVGVASGDTVNVQVNATAVADNAVAAEVLTDIADNVIAESGYTDADIKSITINKVSATTIDEMRTKAQDILGGMTIEEAKKALGSSRSITVELENGSTVNLFVQI